MYVQHSPELVATFTFAGARMHRFISKLLASVRDFFCFFLGRLTTFDEEDFHYNCLSQASMETPTIASISKNSFGNKDELQL